MHPNSGARCFGSIPKVAVEKLRNWDLISLVHSMRTTISTLRGFREDSIKSFHSTDIFKGN